MREFPPRESVGGEPGDAGLVTDAGALGTAETELRSYLADAVDALGSDRVTGLVMPAYLGDAAPAQEAELVADVLGIERTRVHLRPPIAAFQNAIGSAPGPADDLVATRNPLARFRTVGLYYVANAADGVVVGSADRTDPFTGRVVKHAETGVDCLPLGDSYRTEVRALGGRSTCRSRRTRPGRARSGNPPSGT